MPSDFVMPKLSDTMEEGKVLRWLKKEGDEVKEGEPLVEVETDKADFQVESFFSGILLKILVDEGEAVPIGSPIAVISKKGEKIAPEAKKEAVEEAPPPKAPPKEEVKVEEKAEASPKKVEAPSPPPKPEKVLASPLARKLAQEKGIDLSTISGSGPRGEITKEDVERALTEEKKAPAPPPPSKEAAPSKVAGEKVKATPLALTLAEKENIVLAEVEGTGLYGRITEADVKRHIEKRHLIRGEVVKELSLMRKSIAKRMTKSKQQAPHFSVTTEIDMGKAMEKKKAIEASGHDVSMSDIILFCTARAIKEMKELNVSYEEEGKIRYHTAINLGLATATPDGLVVPVIKNADTKRLSEISQEATDLVERARSRSLKGEEFSGSTFTVSNMGMFGVEDFAAIINPPEAAIMAVGSIKKRPVVMDGQIKAAFTMKVTLSVDHRVVDGKMGALFLQKVKSILEEPEKWGNM